MFDLPVLLNEESPKVTSNGLSPLLRHEGAVERQKLLGLGVVFPLLGPLLSLTDKLTQLEPHSAPARVGDLLIEGE